MPRDRAALMDIILATNHAAEFLQGMTRAEFLVDARTQAAIVRQIEIVGEACGRLSREFRSEHPAVPWRDIIAMRNFLIHEYDEVDNFLVWKTAAVDLPALRDEVQALLEIEEGTEGSGAV
jgi:uncharacterized protein with HEPN domain